MNVDMTVKGAGRAEQHIDEMGDRAKDPKPVLNVVADAMQRDQALNFAGRGGQFGSWPALAESTVARKRSKGQPITPLVATGALERSLQKGRGKGKIRRVSKGRITVGSRIFYGRFAQAGTSRGEPRRPIVGILPRRGRVARRMIGDYISKGRW